MSAADTYIAMIDAASVQRARIHGEIAPGDRYCEVASARRLRADPRRALNANMELLVGFIQPTDVLLDVGGGAGRIGLLLALGCREVINVDPSPIMLREFDDCAAEAGISNVRSIVGDWVEVPTVTADVVLSSHVTYFVRDIVPFIQKLNTAARRRVIIDISSTANPNRSDYLFRLVYGEDQATLPALRELMEVIWELGILPDIKVLPQPFGDGRTTTREAAIEQAMEGTWFAPGDQDKAARILESRFDELFSHETDGYRALWPTPRREVIITWEP